MKALISLFFEKSLKKICSLIFNFKLNILIYLHSFMLLIKIRNYIIFHFLNLFNQLFF